MTWFEVRKDAAGNRSIVKHKGAKPDNIPELPTKKPRKPSNSKSQHSSISASKNLDARESVYAKSGRAPLTAKTLEELQNPYEYERRPFEPELGEDQDGQARGQ